MIRRKVKNVEFIDDPVEKKEQRIGSFKGLIDGSLFTMDGVVSQLPFILFLTLLAFIYIGNRYRAEKIVRETISLQKEMKELRAEAITTSSELMSLSKQSEVAKLVERKGLGLKESVEPPSKLIVSKRK